MKASWNDTRQLLEAALAQPPEERAAFVRRACRGDRDLSDEVLALLDLDTCDDELLDGDPSAHVAGDLAGWSADAGESRPGERVGPYRLLEAIGEGGTSTVYRAVRTSGEPVALKLLHPGLVRGELRARFEAEREVLSSLCHPGIVAVLDAGQHRGRPYLAVELVDGVPIDAHCRQRGCDERERLTLFLLLADAVHHAHTHLVVHRDLKPANVLVTRDGRPKVLDFGVAKLLGDLRDHTRPGGRAPLTPAYASPEQLAGAPIRTTSDVYSLGVLLGELLCGVAPRAGMPVVPGTVRGALRAVLVCATHADPKRRYASVHELAEDVRRVLERRPVLAARPSALEVLLKWMRRNPLPGAVATLGLAALLAALAIRSSSLERARASESVAWGAHANAVYVTDVWADVLARAASGELAGPDDERALLADAERRIEVDLGERPEAEARLRNGLGRAYLALGETDAALRHARAALALARDTRGLAASDVRANLSLLTEVLLARGDPSALGTARELVAACAERLGPDHERTAGARELERRVRARFADAAPPDDVGSGR